MPSGIKDALKALAGKDNPDIELPDTLSSTANINVIDIYPVFKHLFSERARRTLESKATQLIHQYVEPTGPTAKLLYLLWKLEIKSADYDDPKVRATVWNSDRVEYTRRFDVVHFFGSRAGRTDLHKAIEKVVLAVNDVADKGYTKASLMPLGILQLACLNGSIEGDFVIVSYVTLTEEGQAYAKEKLKSVLFEEASLPDKVENQ